MYGEAWGILAYFTQGEAIFAPLSFFFFVINFFWKNILILNLFDFESKFVTNISSKLRLLRWREFSRFLRFSEVAFWNLSNFWLSAIWAILKTDFEQYFFKMAIFSKKITKIAQRFGALPYTRPGATGGIPGRAPQNHCLCSPKRELCPPMRGLCTQKSNRLGSNGV